MIKQKENIFNSEVFAAGCGRTEVQIYFLTKRINEINEHIKANPHDFAAKRGNMCLIGKRNKLCKYFKKKYGEAQYQEIIIDMIGLRK
jgi:small subunit ribosomal protein S15